MSENMPAVIDRYLAAAEAGDTETLASCFTEDGTVLDEGTTYRGRPEIIRWRDETLSKWTYTTTLLGSEPVGDSAYRVTVRVEGNFPGGTADLGFDFVLADGLIRDLRIG
jgi:ketosteroid isomerase-like protein